MAESKSTSKSGEPTERTPKGLKVPVPKRDTFFANLKKVAKVPRKGSAPRGAQK